MEFMTDRVIFYYIFFASMIILVTMLWGLTKYKKLTNFQKNNRNNFVIKQGIDKSRISGKGYGESKLLNSCACEGKVKPNCSEDEHAKNRRTEFIIVKLKN